MAAIELLDQLGAYGISVMVDRDELVLRPASKVPADLLAQVKEHKPEILARLRPLGDGQAPPLDRPPATEQELRRLYDHWREPGAFTRWLEWAMNYTDPSEK